MNTDITNNIARKMLAKNILNDNTLSLADLFCIRDHCLGLARYNLHDQDLLNQTLQFITQKIGE